MSQILRNSIISSGDIVFHTPEFMTYVHVHKPQLLAASVKVPLDPGIVHKFEYNFTSLLVELGYPIEDIVILMAVNGFTCPTEMTREFKELILPNQELLSIMKRMFKQSENRI